MRRFDSLILSMENVSELQLFLKVVNHVPISIIYV